MDTAAQFEAVVELFGRLGIQVREEHLGGSGGDLCVVCGRRVVFVDLDADVATRLHRSLRALAALPELETVYVQPALRGLIERLKT